KDFIGLSREDARIEVKKRFKPLGLLGEVKPYRHSVGHSYRSHAAIEPYLSDQWYCKVTDEKLRGWANDALVPEQRSAGSLGGTGLRPVHKRLNPEKMPLITPAGFMPRDPYPPKEPSPNDLMGSIRNLPHLELDGATYFVTWRTLETELDGDERSLVLQSISY